MANQPLTVFFTGGGGAGTIEVIRALKAKEGRYEIIAADASVASAGFAFADRSYVVPFGSDPRFDDALREILRRERPDFIVPLVDEEIPKVHRLVAAEFAGTRVVAPTLEFCELVLDKWTMAEAMRGHELAVARTWLASDANDACYPAIIKPRRGRGSRGLGFLHSPADLQAYLDGAPLSAEHYLVQERVAGREFTTSVVAGLDGHVMAVVPKEAVDKRGITQIGVTRSVPAIDALCREIASRMRPNGPFNVQLMLRDDGTPWVFEINPRYSTTVALTLAAGVNEVEAVLLRACGEDPGPLRFEPDLMMVRYTAQVYAKEHEWKPIDLRSGA